MLEDSAPDQGDLAWMLAPKHQQLQAVVTEPNPNSDRAESSKRRGYLRDGEGSKSGGGDRIEPGQKRKPVKVRAKLSKGVPQKVGECLGTLK